MEEKYWMRLVSELKLSLQAKDRFCQDERVFQILEQTIGSFTMKTPWRCHRMCQSYLIINLSLV